jgi:signal transduction histidine kinase
VSRQWTRPWRTLRGRFALGCVVVIMAATVGFAAVAVSLVRIQTLRAERNLLDDQAMAVATIVSDQAEQGIANGVLRLSKPKNLEAFAGRGTQIYYKGLPLDPGAAKPTGGLPRTDVAIDPVALERDGVVRVELIPPGASEPTPASAAPVRIGGKAGQIIGAVVLARPGGASAIGWRDFTSRVLAAAAAGLVLAVLVALLLAGRVSRPLRELEKAAERVAGGDLSTKLEPSGAEDLERLALAFNGMVERLAERDEMARDFLMKVTHDLRTPLTAIRGHASALSDGIVPEDQVPRSLDAIEAEAARLDGLVADLLDLAKMEAHRFSLNLAELRPDELLEQAFDAFGSEAARRDLRYERRLEPLPTVVTDGARVRQIVGNLLDNALRWTPAGGTVRLEARERAGGLEVVVADTGPGIAEADHEAVFEPFRWEPTPDGRAGTGLGLTIARQLARALGGDLTVESREGAGSRFRLTLPARTTEPTPALVG